MKEHGILFSAPMVRAILAGEKTQTRRVVKVPEWWPDSSPPGTMPRDAQLARERRLADMLNEQARKTGWPAVGHFRDGRPDHVMRCPYGGVGGRLWVRETHAIERSVEGRDQARPHNDGRPVKWGPDGDSWKQPHYRATDPDPELLVDGRDEPSVRWTPSILMPRWASRITLEVTGVRVERVQDISDEDVAAEGVTPEAVRALVGDTIKMGFISHDGTKDPRGLIDVPVSELSLRDLWRAGWVAINGAESWDANPWCWVIEFKRVTP